MNRIQLLPEVVANQIAAGEVIERPASVLKELVENALDAGARQIEVTSRQGGRSLLQVTDDGCGMSRDDALLCLERHATSKLRVSADLAQIASYGFRGEAIPSIASVSKFRLRTREADAIAGTEIVVEGGKLLHVNEAGMAPGTEIEIRSLFFNLPARRKFLRTEATESAHLRQQMILFGLARPDVAFLFVQDEQPVYRWNGGQDLLDRARAIYGPAWVESLLEVRAEAGDLKLHGYIGKPGISRANRQEEHVFVNQRPVVNRTIQYGLLEGYHNSLMRGRFPVGLLFLEMDPAGVDVNIHPAKREVRFHDDMRVRQFVVAAVQSALREGEIGPVSVGWEDAAQTAVTQSPSAPTAEQPPLPAETTAALLALRSEFASEPPDQAKFNLGPAADQPRPPTPAATSGNRLSLRILGDVAHLYIVAESPEGLVLIDQHAAHERVLFERMLRRLEAEEIVSQRLLLPVTIELPPRETVFLRDQMETLNKIGVGLSLFGPQTFMIDALPPMVKAKDVAEFMRTLVVELQQEGGETRKNRRLSEEVVAKTVCRHAVKANDRLKPEEWENLLTDLLACDLPFTCPHGRPTMIQLSKGELEKKFGRAG